ncbi:MAG: ABC transporter ATP-binding protein [Candidatus Margulisiibacteriota bacterium]|jgi:oligopeptide/dipeptide ABC transporter ATP-binding protein
MLKIENLSLEFKVGNNFYKALDNLSFEIKENEFIGLVGESGSGKSVTALTILSLLPSNAIVRSGSITWQGQDLLKLSNQQMRLIRGKEIGLIFQNPLTSLNPVYSIGNQLIETIRLHEKVNKKIAKEIAIDLLNKVNIQDPEKKLRYYPHQFSLGMCQRIMIAITLAMKPKLLIADEPTASLDVTIQAQILDLLAKIKEEYKMAILFISHDLGIIAQNCEKVLIMYLGQLMEKASVSEIFHKPQHPYTQALINAIPNPNPSIKNKTNLKLAEIPVSANIIGCKFNNRCPAAFEKCFKETPQLITRNNLEVACFLSQQNS